MENLIICNFQDLKNYLSEIENRIITTINTPKIEKVHYEDLMTTAQVSKFLQVSLTTIHEWSKHGILIKHKVGHKTRFKKEEVLSALTQLETKKSKSWKR